MGALNSRKALEPVLYALMFWLGAMALAVCWGSVSVWTIDPQSAHEIFNLRAQRALTASFAGASLSVCGAVLQRVLRNPLADPSVLGFSSGGAALTALVAVFGIRIGMLEKDSLGQIFGAELFSWGGFLIVLGCFVSFVILFFLWRKLLSLPGSGGKASDGASAASNPLLILSGLLLNTFFASALMIAFAFADASQMYRIQQWLMGSVRSLAWSELAFCGITLLFVLGWVQWQRKKIILFSLGELYASSRGVKSGNLMAGVLGGLCLLIGLSTASCGSLGFVGLIVPHVVSLAYAKRTAWPRELEWPVVAFCGAAFVVVADTLARAAIPESEVPVGVFLSLLGAPFLLVFLLRSGGTRGT